MFGWLVLILGIVYGYITPGRQDKMALFKTAILIGLVVGLVFAAISWFTGYSALGFGGDIISVVISAIIIAVLFVIGAWVGDFIEDRMKAPKRT